MQPTRADPARVTATVSGQGGLMGISHHHQIPHHRYCRFGVGSIVDTILNRAVAEISADHSIAGLAAVDFLLSRGLLVPVPDPDTAIRGSTLTFDGVDFIDITSEPPDLPGEHTRAAVVVDGDTCELLIGNSASPLEAAVALMGGVAGWLQDKIGVKQLAQLTVLHHAVGPGVFTNELLVETMLDGGAPPHVADAYQQWAASLTGRL